MTPNGWFLCNMTVHYRDPGTITAQSSCAQPCPGLKLNRLRKLRNYIANLGHPKGTCFSFKCWLVGSHLWQLFFSTVHPAGFLRGSGGFRSQHLMIHKILRISWAPSSWLKVLRGLIGGYFGWPGIPTYQSTTASTKVKTNKEMELSQTHKHWIW